MSESFLQLSKNPIFVALDVDRAEEAVQLAKNLAGHVGGFKIGPRLLVRHGAALIEEIAKRGLVFVDNKYFDIPSTMTAAIRATFEAGASFATVHAMSGSEALAQLASLEAELNKQRPFITLAVTILTSFSQEDLPTGMKRHPVSQHVNDLADATLAAGLKGIVCSAHETAEIRRRYLNAFIVTPGVRLEGDAHSDQKRVAGPAEAIRAGASALVVGRSIIGAKDPVAAAERFLQVLRT